MMRTTRSMTMHYIHSVFLIMIILAHLHHQAINNNILLVRFIAVIQLSIQENIRRSRHYIFNNNATLINSIQHVQCTDYHYYVLWFSSTSRSRSTLAIIIVWPPLSVSTVSKMFTTSVKTFISLKAFILLSPL